jgi:hypothetical protein
MTTAEILKTLKKAGKPVGLAQLYIYFSRLAIRPAVRTRPANYPPDTAERILAHLGFSTAAVAPKPLPTRRELRREREKAIK